MSAEKIARVEAARRELAAAEADLVEKHEFPKWVVPHASHIVDGVAPAFAESNTDRKGVLSVLVNSADEEAAALAEKVEAKPAEAAAPAETPAEAPAA